MRIVHDIAFRKELGITLDSVSQDNFGMRLNQHWCPLLAYPQNKISAFLGTIDQRTFSPLAIKKCLRLVPMSFYLSVLDTLQVECLVDVSIIEQILHHEKVSLGLDRSRPEIFNLNRIKPSKL